MENIVFYLLVILFSFLQVSFFNSFPLYMSKPDLVLVMLVIYGLRKDAFTTVFAGFFCGLTVSFTSGSSFGFNALTYITAGFLTALIREKIINEGYILPLAVVFIVSIIKNIFMLLLLVKFNYIINFGSYYVDALVRSLYNLIFAFPVLAVYDLIESKIIVKNQKFSDILK